MRITWKELAIDLQGQPSDKFLEDWRWLVPSSYALCMVSALGDAFLEDTSGCIHWLDVGSAELKRIANSRDHFDRLRQDSANADLWFAPQLVGDLITAVGPLEPGQCFSYKIPLTLNGKFEPDNFEPSSLLVHFSLLGQIQKQVKDVPAGTVISEVRLEK